MSPFVEGRTMSFAAEEQQTIELLCSSNVEQGLRPSASPVRAGRRKVLIPQGDDQMRVEP